MSWLSSIERRWRHFIDDLGFFGSLVDFSFGAGIGWYTISKYLREYETYYKVSSTPLIDDWNVSNLLNGAVLSHQLDRRIPLYENLKDASLNSMYSRFNHIANKVCNVPKYKNALGKPLCTEFNTKISLKALSNATGLEVTDYDMCPFNSLLHSYNYLVETYGFIVNLQDLYIQDKDGLKQYSSLGTLTYEGKEYHLVNIYSNTSLDSPTNIHIVIIRTKTKNEISHTDTTIIETVDIELPIQTEDGTFYYIHHLVDNVLKITAIPVGTNPSLDKIFTDNSDLNYPCFVLKACGVYTKEQKFRDEFDSYGITRKLLKRSSLDWDDIYDQITSTASNDKDTTEDNAYREDLKDVTNIVISLACDITTNSQPIIEYMFKLFKQYYLEHHSLSDSFGELFYKHSVYEHRVTWNKLTYTKKQGHICHWKQYAAETKDEVKHRTEVITVYDSTGSHQVIKEYNETNRVLYIYYQVSRDEYYEIAITGLIHITNAFGKEVRTDLPSFCNLKPRTKKELQEIIESRKSLDEDGNTDNSEFLLPLYQPIVKKLGAFKGSTLLSLSLRVIWQAKKRIKKKWYATTGFTVIRIITSIVIIIVTWGSGTPFVVAANVAVNVAINILIQLLIALAIKLAIKYICKIFHIEGKALIVANLVASLVQLVVNAQLGVSLTPSNLMIMGAGSGIADMILNKNLSLEGFADTLSTAAFTSLSASMPTVAVTYKLLQDPAFLEGVQNRDWASVLVKTAATYAEAMAISKASNITEDITKALEEDSSKILLNQALNTTYQTGVVIATDTTDYAAQIQNFEIELAQLQQTYIEREKAYNELLARNNYLNNILLNSMIGA